MKFNGFCLRDWLSNCSSQSVYFPDCMYNEWKRSVLMVSQLNSGSSGPGSSPGRGHCVVFLGKTLYSHSASLHPGVQMGTSKIYWG